MAARKVVVYGGTGYVGSNVVQRLSARGIPTVAVSRSGKQPQYLTAKLGGATLPHVEWLKGDATEAATLAPMLDGASCVVTTIGSPPLPTFSKDAYDHQVLMNGGANVNVIDAAQAAGVKRVVLCSAHVWPLLQRPGFGYWVGKEAAAARLAQFVDDDGAAEGIVLRPGTITGTRYTVGGSAIPLGAMMAPVAMVQRAAAQVLPYVHHLGFVSVEQVAEVIVSSAVDAAPIEPRLKAYDNDSIRSFAAAA
eukprot:TRINITY_DN14503_c1_g1_i1.p1 TRINITY_DN14503_c1_g1~~TRINITY_DN14503_c1_g1_i1.p1  ORF type:complete len:250 (+),score=70.91 TRINITY_DN14503_c1_g1_i1:60-809(+)